MSSVSSHDIERFRRLYAGYSKAHVRLHESRESSGQSKIAGRYTTLAGPPSEEAFREHLKGSVGLGIIPLLDDGKSVSWGGIDFDKIDCDHTDLESRITTLGLPLVCDRSKSGGAHLVMFLEKPTDATYVVRALRLCADQLGLPPNVEIFPKQTSRLGIDNPGSCLNLPYFGADGTTRYGISGGQRLSLEEYLTHAEERRIHLEAAPPVEHNGLLSAKASEGRNSYLFSAGCRLRRAGQTEAEIQEALLLLNRTTNSTTCANFASGPLRESEVLSIVKNVMRYERGASDEEWLDGLNRRYAIVQAGSKVLVLQENEGEFELLAPSQFKLLYSNKRTILSGRSVPVAIAWLDHPQRREFSRIVFEPGPTLTQDAYNLWRGFTVIPAPGDCSLFLAHIRDNIAQGNEEHFKYLVSWFAAIVQEPARKVGTSVVLRGKMGCGKSIVGEIFGKLLGKHYRKVARADQVVGRFNAHLESCLLLQAEEAFWAGNHEAEGVIKDLITNSTQQIERKGIDLIEVANHVRLLITSNADWVVPAGFQERRFAVFDVAETQLQNRDYFGAIIGQLETGGYGALLEFLIRYDLDWDFLHKIPETAALAEQKVHSLGPSEQWMVDLLNSGYLPGDQAGNGRSPRPLLHAHYSEHAQRRGVRSRASQTLLGMFLNKMFQGRMATEYGSYFDPAVRGEKNCRVNVFPTLQECRTLFADKHKFVEWDGPDEWQPEPDRRSDGATGSDLPF